jgi:hypothetical protein
VFHNPQIDSTSVYVPYQLKGKAYKHWFYVVTLPTSPDTTEVKIIDTEGYDLEKAIETVVEVNARKLKNEIALLREAFKVDK